MVARTNKAFYEHRITSKKLSASQGHPVRAAKDDGYRRNYERLCRGTNIKVSPVTARDN